MQDSTGREIVTVAGRDVAISNPGKVLFPEAGYTKLDLARYYLAVSEGALRAAGDRPNVLVRYPDGIGGEFFFQKRAPASRPDWIDVVTLRFPSGRVAEEIVPRDAAALVWMANMACLELHPHPVRADDLDHPDELRVDLDPVPGVEWPQVLLFLSMITMTVGNLCALNQRNLKRMLAYSGIAHAGYMMMGLAVLNNDGLSAILFYIVVYLIMNVGAFLVVAMIANVTGDEDIETYRGLAWRGAIVPAVCMAVFLFSLTGLPPFAGFIGKFFLFSAVLKQGGAFAALALVAALNSVISLYYYAKIVKTMFLDMPNPEDKPVAVAVNDFTLLIPLTVLTIVFGVYFGPLVQYTSQSLRFFVK